MKKIIVIGAHPKSLVNFRGEFIKLLVKKKYRVIAMASNASLNQISKIESLGAEYIDYPIQRNGLNPLKDIKTYLTLLTIFNKEKPDHIFAYTIKPIIWGAIAAKSLPNSNFHALVTGLGFAFQKGNFVKNFLVTIVSMLYKFSLKNVQTVIFQNNDNRLMFLNKNLVTEQKTTLINGSGVDVRRFQYQPINTNQTKFLLIARLLKDKGIAEYIEAAKLVKEKYPEAIFEILGPEDPSPNHFPMREIKKYHDLDIIKYLGLANNVIPYIEACQIYVLPSYHEGLPRTVIEAMAVGRPILTTNAPGCKDTVIEGENGFLIPIKNSNKLKERMIWFIQNKDQWQDMGKQSRKIAEDKFDVHKVNNSILEIMRLK